MQGVKVMFRTKEEREVFILENGGMKNKSNWFRGDRENTTTIVTVPTTTRGCLARSMQTTLASCPPSGRCRSKVLEGEGTTVQRIVVKSNPYSRQSCARLDCLLDKASDIGCREMCLISQQVEGKSEKNYIGETARPIFTRSKQHLDAYRYNQPGRKPIESWMWEHAVSHHGGIVGPNRGAEDYLFRLQGRFSKPLSRQVDEAVRLGQIDHHGKVLDDERGPFCGPVTCLN